MGLFRRAAAKEDPSGSRQLQRRLAELEDDVASLERRFESLRGSVTGGRRYHDRQAELHELRAEVEQLRAAAGPLAGEELELDQDADTAHAIGAHRRFGRTA